MSAGAHTIVFAEDAEAARAFFRDVLDFPAVDAGDGWLIFGLPPTELACHPGTGWGAQPGQHVRPSKPTSQAGTPQSGTVSSAAFLVSGTTG